VGGLAVTRPITPEQYRSEIMRTKRAQILSQPPKKVNIHEVLTPVDPKTARQLARYRKGKRTVALVGLAPSSCSKAGFEDESVEIWGVNEGHFLSWMKRWGRWDRWFQMHKPVYYQREVDLGGHETGHYDWLKQDHGDKPIYMLDAYDDVPNAVKYPLAEVSKAMSGLRIGMKKNIKFYHSTFDYMIALAIHEKFERIEIYGFEFGGDYEHQRYSAYTWKGIALGKGIEIYEPKPSERLFDTLLYGYAYTNLKGGERVSNASKENGK
jgi:hypothetical protein